MSGPGRHKREKSRHLKIDWKRKMSIVSMENYFAVYSWYNYMMAISGQKVQACKSLSVDHWDFIFY